MDVAITAIGTANPIYKRPQKETAELIIAGLNLNPVEKRLLKTIYRATGIQYRHSVLPDYCREAGNFEFFPNDPSVDYPSTAARMQIYKDNALGLALAAIEDCLSNAKSFNLTQITHLITVSCTGMYAPGLDIEIVQTLKLNSSTKRTAINFMGCYGVFNALKVAESICNADLDAAVLIVSVELCTIHFQKNMSLDNMISNAIFADGAAAALIQAKPKTNKYFSLKQFHCDLVPQTSHEMAWTIADKGFDIVLSTYVPQVIQEGIATFAEQLLNAYQCSFEHIDFFAIHPGGLKVLQACEESLKITQEDNRFSYQILKDYGNMSSATVLFVLKAIWDDITQAHHEKMIFSSAFGPGLTLESLLLGVHYV